MVFAIGYAYPADSSMISSSWLGVPLVLAPAASGTSRRPATMQVTSPMPPPPVTGENRWALLARDV